MRFRIHAVSPAVKGHLIARRTRPQTKHILVTLEEPAEEMPLRQASCQKRRSKVVHFPG